ncbi:Arm DNA-binding domain-containing protein [Peribacillus sp. ACCC06369]|nr:Arm DNA-binding domain-containing protein [Peribacillus sp. ACCC06369]
MVNVAKDPVTGKRRQITKSGFKTKKEAQLAANKVKVEDAIANGGVFQESNITFEESATEWLSYYGHQVKISSVRARKIALKHLISSWQNTPLKKITKHMYQSRINELNKEFSHNYIDSIHTTGNMIFKHAIRQDLIKTNPTYGFVMPKKHVTVEDIEEDEVKEKFLELNELKTFLRITKEHGLYLDYLCFFYFGIYRYALRRNASIKMDRPGPY